MNVLSKFSGKSNPKRFVATVAIKVVAAVANYAALVSAARLLGETDFGVFSLILTISLLAGVFANVGIQNTALRFVNEYRAKKERGLEKGAVEQALRSTWSVAAIVTALAAVGVVLGWSAGWIEYPIALAIGMLLIPGFTVIDTASAIARSYGSIAVALLPRDVVWRLLLIPAAFAAVAIAAKNGSALVLFISIAAVGMLVAIFVQHMLLRKMYAERFADVEPQFERKKWQKVAMPLWAAALSAVALRSIDVIFLGLILSPAQLGGYFAASRTALLLSFVHASLNVLVGPEIARAFHADDGVRLRKVLGTSALLAFVPALGLFVIFALIGDWILSIFSSGFAEFWLVLMILSVGQLVSAFAGSSGLLMNMTGHERQSLRFLIIVSIPGLAAMIALGWFYGPPGAALGIAGWQAARNILIVVYARRVIGFDPSVLSALWLLDKRANTQP